jgi:hypothetical protein
LPEDESKASFQNVVLPSKLDNDEVQKREDYISESYTTVRALES